MPRSVEISAPGSVMLFGEHAVLRGGPAIVAAIDRRLSLRLTRRDDTKIVVRSSFGSVTTSCQELLFGPSLRFVEGVFRFLEIPFGVSVDIDSTIDSTVGLASSAAVTVALITALQQLVHGRFERQKVLQDAYHVIRLVQGHGSGADAASIVYGGVILYRMEQQNVTTLCSSLPLVLVYSGKKTPTPEVIRLVQEREKDLPGLYRAIFSAIDEVTERAIGALRGDRLSEVGLLMNQANGLMEALLVGTRELSELYWRLRRFPTIFGAKISGSGLGDAVVGLGAAPRGAFEAELPSKVSQEGVMVVSCEE